MKKVTNHQLTQKPRHELKKKTHKQKVFPFRFYICSPKFQRNQTKNKKKYKGIAPLNERLEVS